MAYIGHSEKLDATVWIYSTSFDHPEWMSTRAFGKVVNIEQMTYQPRLGTESEVVQWRHMKVAEKNSTEQQKRFTDAYDAESRRQSDETIRLNSH